MSFVDFGDGTVVNFDHVQSVSKYYHGVSGKCGVTVKFADGSTLKIEGDQAYGMELEKLTASVIPAAQGFEMLRCWFWKDHEPEVCREPIIAWRIGRDCWHWAVTLDEGPSYGTGREAILRPDGVVVDVGSETWENAEAWTAHVREQWKQWCAQDAAA